MATYQFGTVGATGIAEGTYGLLQSFNKNTTTEEAVAPDANGNVAHLTLYNATEEITAEYIYDTTTTAPVAGDTITIGTKTYAVTSTGLAESNTDYTKLSITLKHYVENAIPDAVSP